MKKKMILISSALVAILIATVLLVILLKKDEYTIRISLVDDRSPDRVLTVYNGSKKIEVRQIKFLDGIVLCDGYNTVVHYGEIENEKELIVILKDKSEVRAKIIKEEVK